jgi:hypothetical protein
MNFKAIGSSVIAASAIATTLAVSPAQALSVGSKVDFAWNAVAETNSIDFLDILNQTGADPGQFIVTLKTGDFTSLPALFGIVTVGSIQDVSPIPFSGNLNNFVTFAGADPKFNFNLRSLTRTSSTLYDFDGFFGDGTPGVGQITTQIFAPGVNSYSAGITAIPTPALLPGVIGFGLAALRKRKAGARDSKA